MQAIETCSTWEETHRGDNEQRPPHWPHASTTTQQYLPPSTLQRKSTLVHIIIYRVNSLARDTLTSTSFLRACPHQLLLLPTNTSTGSSPELLEQCQYQILHCNGMSVWQVRALVSFFFEGRKERSRCASKCLAFFRYVTPFVRFFPTRLFGHFFCCGFHLFGVSSNY